MQNVLGTAEPDPRDVSLTSLWDILNLPRLKETYRIENSKSFHMARRDQWRRVLDIEVQRWSAMTPEQLASALDEQHVYEVELDSRTYQVEVDMLESTEEYFHVMVAVDDGTLPASMVPETQTFICNKKFPNT